MALEVVKARCLGCGNNFRICFFRSSYKGNVHERAEFLFNRAAEHLGLIEEIVKDLCLFFVHLCHNFKAADPLEVLEYLTADVNAPAVGGVVH